MGKVFRSSILLVKRWFWIVAVSVIICGSITYLISFFLRPVYQASAYLIVDINVPAHAGLSKDIQDTPTFAQFITAPSVLGPVAAQYPGMSRQHLLGMISVKPQTNTQFIELDVQATDPRLAANLANQVGQSFAQYANGGLPGTVQIIQAQTPTLPDQSRLLENAAIGSAAGVAGAILLLLFFQWRGKVATSIEQIQALLGREILTVLPGIPDQPLGESEVQPSMAEKYQTICARLAEAQMSKPFKLLLFTSVSGEKKSVFVSNVAMNLARAGKQVLLIDLNIDCPALSREFHLHSQLGLTNFIGKNDDKMPLEYYIQKIGYSGLYVITTGTQKMNSIEFYRSLAAVQFFSQLRQTSFDYILFDAPVLSTVADTHILVSSIEAMVLTIDGLRTPRRALAQAQRVLWRLQAMSVLGVIIHQCPWRDYPGMDLSLLAQIEKVTSVVDQPTQVLPTLAYELLETSELVTVREHTPLPDSGESEPVSVGVSEYVIRPMLSLNGLAMPTNGLTGRFFDTPHTPQPL